MFKLRLVLVRTEDQWVFRVGNGFRALNLAAAAVLVVAGFVLGTFTVPVILASLAVLGALYEETVLIDRKRNRVELRLGLLVFHRTKAFALTDVAEVRTTVFGPARFTGLELGLRDGRVLTIENDRGKASAARQVLWGAELASWIGVPFVDQSAA